MPTSARDQNLHNNLILDHYRNPRRKGRLVTATVQRRDVSRFCGDEVTVALHIEGGLVIAAAFDGRGCSLSMAAADVLMEMVVGRSVAEIAAMEKDELLERLGVEVGIMREKCVTLPLGVLHECMYMSREGESEVEA